LSDSAIRDLAARSKPFHGFNSSASSEESVPASKDSFGRIHYDWKQSRLTFTNNSILFLNNFLVGPEGLGRKTSKDRPNVLMARMKIEIRSFYTCHISYRLLLVQVQ
jgi:hypothetical protein